MIEFFLNPARARARVMALLIGGGLVFLAAAGLLVACVFLSGRLDAEVAGHRLTAHERDAAVLEGLRWKAVAEAGDAGIAALQDSVRACQVREGQAVRDAAERAAILREDEPRERAAAEKKGVVSDATRKKAVLRLNRQL